MIAIVFLALILICSLISGSLSLVCDKASMRSNVMLRKSLLTRKLNNAPISVRHRTTAIFVSDFSDESADEIVEEKDVVQSGEQEEQLQEDVADEPPAVEDKLAQAIKEAEKKLQDQLSVS